MRRIPILPTLFALLAALPAQAQVLRWAELNTAQVAALDPARTVVLIPGGILEEHGPHIPVNADGYRNEQITEAVAAAVTARPGWTAVILPMVPIGAAAFNRMGGRPSFPGSVAVRAATVQAVFTDFVDALGAQGFRHVFVVHGHGDPNHNRALDLAGDYFRVTYGGMMVHLLGRVGCQAENVGPPPPELFGAEAAEADAGSPHAGALETARTWFLRPDLVDSVALRRVRDVPAAGPGEWMEAGAAPDWPGYVGAPRFATLELGRWIMERETAGCTELALRLLDGVDEATVPRYADQMLAIPPVREIMDAHLREDEAQAARQAAWQAQAPRRP